MKQCVSNEGSDVRAILCKHVSQRMNIELTVFMGWGYDQGEHQCVCYVCTET